MMALFLSPRDPDSGFRWLRICDFVQVCTLVLAVELAVVFVPSRWQVAAQAMQNRTLNVGLVFFGLLALSFLVRGLLSPFRTVRNLFQRLAVFFFVFGMTTNVTLHALASGNYKQGTWPDLLWTIAYCLLAVLAATWNDSEYQMVDKVPPPSRSSQLLGQFSPLLIPAIVFPLVLRIAQEQFLWSVVLVMVSFAAASGRLFVVQNQLLASSLALQQSQQKLRIHFEHTPLAVVEWSPEFRVAAWNHSAEEMFGYSLQEALGKHGSFIVPPQFRPQVDQAWDDLINRKGGGLSTNDNLTRDGRTIHCEWYNTPLVDDSGRVLGVASLVQDITEHVALEERLRQAHKMEAVGRLAGGVAHDFNNLLTVILGYAQILADSLSPGSREADSTAQIKSAADRASGITRQLLAFSRKQVLSPRVIDLNDIMLNLDSLLRRLIGEDIEVHSVPARDLGTVKADRGQIEQVIMNLALNARDAMPHGGKITLETSNALLDETYARKHQPIEPGRYVMLAVTDTGDGMTSEMQARIFEPFYTTKEVGKGTGLGLATVYGIVKQSGGYIWVYSEPNRGTSFKIYLPRVDQPAETLDAEKTSDRVQRGTETVLLVEDEPQLRQLTSSVLAHCGYKMLVAGGPEEGLAIFKANLRDIRLLITDVVMPGMNGRQLAAEILKVSPKVQVLYISGYTSNAIVHYGVLDAGLWFLPKPFTLSALVAKVREVLDASPEPPQGDRLE
jgi:PAS domain S-box-containing protein